MFCVSVNNDKEAVYTLQIDSGPQEMSRNMLSLYPPGKFHAMICKRCQHLGLQFILLKCLCHWFVIKYLLLSN